MKGTEVITGVIGGGKGGRAFMALDECVDSLARVARPAVETDTGSDVVEVRGGVVMLL